MKNNNPGIIDSTNSSLSFKYKTIICSGENSGVL